MPAVKTRHFLQLVLLSALWGASFLFIRVASPVLGPNVMAALRIGTPAMTTRGFKEEEARITANLIADVLDNPRDEANIAAVRAKVNALTARFPVYR